MILREGFSKKKCHLMDGKVMIDGIETSIGRIQEIRDYKFRCKIALIVMIFTGGIAGFLFYGALFEGYKANRHIDYLIIICATILYLVGLSSFVASLRYYSCWRIDNSIFNYLLVEKSDGEILHNQLKAMESDKGNGI